MIKKVGNKFYLYSKKTGKVLGRHDSKESAEGQEAAINIRKAGHSYSWSSKSRVLCHRHEQYN